MYLHAINVAIASARWASEAPINETHTRPQTHESRWYVQGGPLHHHTYTCNLTCGVHWNQQDPTNTQTHTHASEFEKGFWLLWLATTWPPKASKIHLITCFQAWLRCLPPKQNVTHFAWLPTDMRWKMKCMVLYSLVRQSWYLSSNKWPRIPGWRPQCHFRLPLSGFSNPRQLLTPFVDDPASAAGTSEGPGRWFA